MPVPGQKARYAVYSLVIAALFVAALETGARLVADSGVVDLSKIITMRTTPLDWERYYREPSLFDGLAGLPVPVVDLVRVDRKAGSIDTVPQMALIRPQHFATDKAPGTLRLLFLGGSSVVGHDMEGRLSFPTRVGETLAARMPGRTVEVFNAGMDAGALCDAADLMDHVGPAFKPDVVVVYGGHNDLIPLQVRNIPEFNNHGLRPAVLWLFERSVLLRLGAYVYFMHHPPDQEKLFRQFEAWYARSDRSEWNAWARARIAIGENYRANLERIAAKAHAIGARVLLASTTSNLNFPPPINIHGPGFDPVKEDAFAVRVEDAEALNVGGRFDELAALTTRLAEDDSYYARARYLAGLALRNLGRTDDALAEFRAARDVTPIYPAMSVAPTFFARVVEEVAAESGAAYVATEPELIALPGYAAAAPGSLFIDSIHPSPEGNRLIASLIVARMEALGWVPPAPAPETDD